MGSQVTGRAWEWGRWPRPGSGQPAQSQESHPRVSKTPTQLPRRQEAKKDRPSPEASWEGVVAGKGWSRHTAQEDELGRRRWDQGL